MTEIAQLSKDAQQLATAKILCVGDVMLDKFVYGAVDRISPEAPIPVFLVTREKHMLGGAGNVAANIVSLGASMTLAAVIGDDAAGADIQKRLVEEGVETALEVSIDRFTTVKSRFVGAGQQMLRVDREKTTAIPASIEAQLLANIQKIIPQVGAVILSDYGKGVLTDTLITGVIATARAHNVPVVVDPKGRDFSRYRGATAVTPNRKELEAATGMTAGSDDEVRAAAMKIIIECGITAVLATRSADGMSLIAGGEEPVHIAANVREIFDVSGAGDTVIATFATGLAAGVSMLNAAQLANIAGGIVVGKPGTATARPEEIIDVIERSLPMQKKPGTAKVMNLAEAVEQVERWKARGAKIGFTNGTFDLLHPGHLQSIRQAKSVCDYLIVAANSDASVKRYKGPTRPIQDQDARAELLAALEMVDLVIIFEEDTPIELLKALKPDFLVKGGQYKLEEVVGYDIVQAYGGKIVRADMVDGMSTTNTVNKINAAGG